MAIELRFREREVALGRGELRVRGLRGELRVFRIEPREHLAAATRARAGVDRARDDLAGHAKAHVRFVARAHLARIDVAARHGAGRHALGHDRSHRLFGDVGLGAGREQQRRGDGGEDVLHLLPFGFISPVQRARSAISTSRS
jgi:hypothetical protein